MKKTKKEKFTLEKFEVAKLENSKSIIGGIGDPITGTETSSKCSFEPGCKDKPVGGNVPVRPSN